jgi:hypothetical protein
LRRSIVLIFLFIFLATTEAFARTTPYVVPPVGNRLTELKKLENFLLNQFNPEVGLLRESPDSSIHPTYWLLSDNLLASLALRHYYPEKAKIVNATLMKYGYLRNGIHEALLGGIVRIPFETPEVITVVNTTNYAVKTEIRKGKVMNDWIDYADLLCYASVSEWNAGHREMAKNYFFRASDMWNGIGLFDKPTRLDGFYSTYKLALLLYTSRLIEESVAYRWDLERILWSFKREDGGVRSHYLGDLTSEREANTETASLILIAYNYGFGRAFEILFKNPYSEALGDPDVEKRKTSFSSDEARTSYVMAKKQYDDAAQYFEARIFELSVIYAQDAYSNYGSALKQEEQHRIMVRYLILGALTCAVAALAFSVYWQRRMIFRLKGLNNRDT